MREVMPSHETQCKILSCHCEFLTFEKRPDSNWLSSSFYVSSRRRRWRLGHFSIKNTDRKFHTQPRKVFFFFFGKFQKQKQRILFSIAFDERNANSWSTNQDSRGSFKCDKTVLVTKVFETEASNGWFFWVVFGKQTTRVVYIFRCYYPFSLQNLSTLSFLHFSL